MIELNYGAVPTSRTDTLARVLDCGDDNTGCISAICEPQLTIHEPMDFGSSVGILPCKDCSGYANYLSPKSPDGKAGWFCSFCNAFNETGVTPESGFYVKRLGSVNDLDPSRTVVIVDLNSEFENDISILKSLEFGTPLSLALVTIEDGSVSIHCSDFSRVIIDAESSKANSKLMKLDFNWFIVKYGLASSKFYMDNETFASKLTQLQFVNNPKSKKRCKRNTALAIFLASCLKPSRSIALIFGPCTVGPGKVISMTRKNHIRQHRNIEGGQDLKYWKEARNFYKGMSSSADFVQCSMFICSLDQIGMWEMEPCLAEVIQYESLSDTNFKYDWETFINNKSEYGITELKIKTSKRLLVNGVYGPVVAMNNSDSNVSDTPKGCAGSATYAYKGPKTDSPSILISLSVDTSRTADAALMEMPDKFCLQVEIYYRHKSKYYVAVDTKFIPSVNLPGSNSLTENFHWQVMVGSIMKRIAFEVLFKDKIYDYNMRRWILEIVKLVKSLNTIHIPNLNPLIKMTYFLQRSTLLQKRNTSPDEWIIYHWLILNYPLSHIFKMVKPDAYSKSGPVEFTSDIVKYNEPLLIDGGNFLVVRDTLAGDDRFEDLREAAIAEYHNEKRFPKPWYRETKPGSSQDRFVVAKLGLLSDHTLFTDDITLDQYVATFYKK